jgi:CHAT domain-containing protein
MDRLGEAIGRTRFHDRPIELLTLSACETAQGDERAALGLAGVAIQAGARSALGTLWSVNDVASAKLVGEFYGQLHGQPISKAMALQRAQQKVLRDANHGHPYFWAPFLLIGNWL